MHGSDGPWGTGLITDTTAEAQTKQLERIVGAAVTSVDRARWGFANRTDFVTTSDGERLVVQRYRDKLGAVHRLRAMDALAEPLAACGIAMPVARRVQLDDDPAWAIFDRLPGVPLPDAHMDGLGGVRFPHLAMRMGDLQRCISSIPVGGLDLPAGWADPPSLAMDASGWLERVSAGLGVAHGRILSRMIDEVPGLFDGRPAVVAHGDFAPVNVLVAEGEITGLLDFESARLADPLFDVAWWSWVVGFHHS